MTKSRSSRKSRTTTRAVKPAEKRTYDVYIRFQIASEADSHMEEFLEAIAALLERFDSGRKAKIDVTGARKDASSTDGAKEPTDGEPDDGRNPGKLLN